MKKEIYTLETLPIIEMPRHKRFKNLLEKDNLKFGKLTVIAYAGSKANSGTTRSYWFCKCECGNIVEIHTSSLKNQHTISCGCVRMEKLIKRNTTHNKSKSPEYQSFCHMFKRCYDKKCKDYPNYGGRGIEVCPEWTNNPVQFLEDMGEKPEPKSNYSIDRIDSNGNYCKENCRWATWEEQANNQRRNVKILYHDKFISIAELSKITNLSSSVISYRIRAGWDVDKIINTPNRNNKRFKNE